MIMIDPAALLAELQRHVDADKLTKGTYWDNGKGCAVGCTLHSYAKVIGKRKVAYSDHALYDAFLGAGGHMLGRLEDCIFEGMTNEDAREWPARFLKSALGAVYDRKTSLERVGWHFLHWLLTDETINPGILHPNVRAAVRQCADVISPLTKGGKIEESAARSAARSAESAASAAWSAAWSAESAAWSAAWSAESAARSAESAAWSAESAARSAASAAASAESAARSAASAAASAESAAWSAESAAWSAESAAFKRMADKLVDLMDAA